jgi:aspartate/methionine/tyrosine aminotransferase
VEATGTVWKDDYEFARDLKAEARIAVNPGSNYGDRRSHSPFRVPYLPGEDVLEGICSRLERFMKKNVY